MELEGGRHMVRITRFVSHTWGAEALPLLDSLVEYGESEAAAGRAAPGFYLDLCVVDQHAIDQAAGDSAMPFEALEHEFLGKIECAEAVLVVGGTLGAAARPSSHRNDVQRHD